VRTLWLQFGGTEAVRKALGIPLLPYPLSYCVPRSSWEVEKSAILVLECTKRYGLCIDLVAEINDEIKNIGKRKAEESIEGFRWCIGLSDESFIREISFSSRRDEGACLYYGRFPNGYNVLSRKIAGEWGSLPKRIIVSENGEGFPVELNLTHSFEATVRFLASFTTLNPGDMVSVGSVYFRSNIQSAFSEAGVKHGKFFWSIKIDKEISH
jgi:2-keto-4-pentenoate hydratase/2-oxohepta-3-ene-1,7-dioic acid hydratase in catechol pathway